METRYMFFLLFSIRLNVRFLFSGNYKSFALPLHNKRWFVDRDSDLKAVLLDSDFEKHRRVVGKCFSFKRNSTEGRKIMPHFPSRTNRQRKKELRN